MDPTEQKTQPDEANRRPLKVRQARFSAQFTQWLCRRNITPNHISIASVVFALLAAIALLGASSVTNTLLASLLALLASAFVQGRLLCNLFDGMVAVEGGKSTASGELFNDIPDRIADPLILVAVGYSISATDWGITLGWLAGLLAVMTAYVRVLAASIKAPVDFCGPMAKQHRMAIVTLACLAFALELWFTSGGWSLLLALLIVVVGSALTVARRARRAYRYLEGRQ